MSPTPSHQPKRGKKILSIAAGLLLFWTVSAAVLFVPLTGWTSADVTTGQHSGYADLQTRRYNMSLENTTRFAAAAMTRNGWRVTRTDLAAGAVQGRKTGFPAPSEMTVTVTSEASDQRISRVSIRSRSTFGFADLGSNARYIRAIQAAMDDKLPRVE
jgi:hypothetical protein